ncbi:MAG: rhodanese-like domain-containing protein [Meiothermus sp.]|nr:rhodanese-like domain-containing protein [Meiothermus sp.]
MRLLAFALLLLLAACAPQGSYKNVGVGDLQAASEPGRVVLDVREPHEYAEGHVAGSRLLPLATVEAQAGQLDKSAPVYVICRSGNRSKTASEALVKMGFKDVRNVEGGILAWAAAGYPVQR